MQLSSPRKTSASAAPKPLAKKLTGFFRYIATQHDGEFLEQVAEVDLSLTQLKALSLLGESDERLSVKEVAEQLGLSLPTASRTVDQLVKRKLVGRREDDEDRRMKRLALTAKGSSVIERLVAARVRSFERMLASLDTDQREALAVALDAVLENPDIAHYCPKGSKS